MMLRRQTLATLFALVAGLVVACSKPPECEKAPGLAAALDREQDKAGIVATAKEIVEATAETETTEGQVLHDRAERVIEAAGEDDELAFSGVVHATVLAGENLAAACR